MRYVPTVLGWGLAALVIYIIYLHYEDRNSSGQTVAPRPSDLARLQLLDQTRTVAAKRAAVKSRNTR